jgi:hypothetical protein
MRGNTFFEAANSFHQGSSVEDLSLFIQPLLWQWETSKTPGAGLECSCLSLPLEASRVLQYQVPLFPRQEGLLTLVTSQACISDV